MWNFLALTFCLMVGTAGLPHILTRYYTTPSVREARTSVAWSLFFIFLLYFTAPAYAAFARFVIYTKLVGTQIADLPRWITLWAPAGLFEVVDKSRDGIVQWADFVVKSTDFVVLSMPEVAGLPFVITGLVMAGGLGRSAVHRRWSSADHRQCVFPRPVLQRHRPQSIANQAVDHHQDTTGGNGTDRRVGGHLPCRDYRRAGGLGF